MCSVAYVVMLERLERWALAAAQAALMARHLGATVSVPEWGQVRDTFDELLAAAPVREESRVDSDDMVLLRAVGLRD